MIWLFLLVFGFAATFFALGKLVMLARVLWTVLSFAALVLAIVSGIWLVRWLLIRWRESRSRAVV
jgi:hypothetical protein